MEVNNVVTHLHRHPPLLPMAVWEIFTAEQLYEGLTVGQVLYAVAYSGSRPTVPPGCPPRYAEVMEACWCSEPNDRCAPFVTTDRADCAGGRITSEDLSLAMQHRRPLQTHCLRPRARGN